MCVCEIRMLEIKCILNAALLKFTVTHNPSYFGNKSLEIECRLFKCVGLKKCEKMINFCLHTITVTVK